MLSFLIQGLDAYVDLVENFIQQQSVLAPLLLLFVEEAGIPIFVPGDGVLAYTGYSIQTSHHSSIWLAFSLAVVAVVVGSSILFFVARRYGQAFISKLGRFIFLGPNQIERAQNLFNRYGVWAIIFGRHVPGMRIPITVFAAVSGVRYRTFILSTLASTMLWIWFYLAIGQHFGGQITHALRRSTTLTLGIAIAAVIVIIAMHLYGARRESKT